MEETTELLHVLKSAETVEMTVQGQTETWEETHLGKMRRLPFSLDCKSKGWPVASLKQRTGPSMKHVGKRPSPITLKRGSS